MFLHRLADGVRRAWILMQVELHGTYSVQRLQDLKKYTTRKSSSFASVTTTLWLTPLPSILVVILMDLPRLSRPGDGFRHSYVFWSRAFITAALIAFTLLQQLRCLLPSLEMTHTQITLVALFVAVSSITFVVGLSSVIGFPLPFTEICNGPMFLVALFSSGIYLWGKQIYNSSQLRSELRQVVSVVMVQWALTLIYPIFNYIFSQLDATGQTQFATVIVLVKMLLKYWLARCMEKLQDLQPGFVIFNVEVFHSLFVACCMQNATSSLTTAALMAMDALHGWISIHDVNCLLDGLTDTLSLTNRDEVSASRAVPPLIDSAVYLLQDPVTAQLVASQRATSSASHLLAVVTQRQPRAGIISVTPVEKTVSEKQSPPAKLASIHPFPFIPVPQDTGRMITENLATGLTVKSIPDLQEAVSTSLNEEQTQRLDRLSVPQRVIFVQRVLTLLHMTEFLLLIEYVEVIIPIIYSTFLVVVFHLPNRVYYPQIHAMTAVSLFRVVWNELLYAVLELISFIVLDRLLWRKLQFRPAYQLGFVLGTQWQVIQAKLILWVVYMAQSSLVHFGADYTFQFNWLGNASYFD